VTKLYYEQRMISSETLQYAATGNESAY